MLKAQYAYFKNLDGLRFLCFLSVFTVHSLNTHDTHIQSNEYFQFIVKGLLVNGGLGVNFFFVLSGFLITYLLILEKQDTGTVNILNFWFKRVIRIWPLYFLCAFFGFVIFPVLKNHLGQVTQESADPKLYLLFLGNFDIIKNGWPDSTELGVLWSISIEEQFYLVWPVLLYFLPIKKYWIIFLTVILISLGFRAFYDSELYNHYHTLSCISDMAVGGLGAWLIHIAVIRNLIVNFSRIQIVMIYLAFALCFVFKDQIFNQIYLSRVFERVIISVLIILIILEQNYSKNSFYKMGNFKYISNLGLTTYGMYMLHVIGILIVVTSLQFLKVPQNIYTILILGPIISLIVSIYMSKLSFNLIEKRFLKLKKYLK